MTVQTEPGPATLEARVREMCPLYEHIGLCIERLDDVIACSVPLSASNVNHLGGMHAAVQWAVAEAIGGIAYFAHPELGDCWIAVRDVTITFHRVARTDLRAEARFDADHRSAIVEQLDAEGTADYQVEIVLIDTDGTAVTTAVGHYYLRRRTTEPDGR